MAAVSVGVSAKGGDRHTFKMQPAAPRRVLSRAPTAFTEAPSSRAPWAPSPPRKEWKPVGTALQFKDRELRSRLQLSGRAVAGLTLPVRSLARPHSLPPAPPLLMPPSALVGTSGSLPAPPVYLQSANGWVPAMDSGMTVACWTEVWVATPVSCCQAGGSRIC